MAWFARLLILPIRGYQRFISPALPPTCRFFPTCSAYAVQAITVHGAFCGSWLAIRRIGRCHPFNAGGVDHVPPRKSKNSVEEKIVIGSDSDRRIVKTVAQSAKQRITDVGVVR